MQTTINEVSIMIGIRTKKMVFCVADGLLFKGWEIKVHTKEIAAAERAQSFGFGQEWKYSGIVKFAIERRRTYVRQLELGVVYVPMNAAGGRTTMKA